MRYSKSNAFNQERQNYLAPLQHEAFVYDTTIDSPVAGAYLTFLAPIYEALKFLGTTGEFNPVAAWARDTIRSFGTGTALTSEPSVAAVGHAFKGFNRGMKDRSSFKGAEDTNGYLAP